MTDVNQANAKLNQLTDKDVRIVYLPPATVAAAHYIGPEPESGAFAILDAFATEANLAQVYPAARNYGFNCPNPGMREDGQYGYEAWLTIPEDMDVPAPLSKKQFAGGLYASHTIFPEDLAGTGWGRLWHWAENSQLWAMDMDGSTGENMNGLLEEKLNYFALHSSKDFAQFDLLMPIRQRENAQ